MSAAEASAVLKREIRKRVSEALCSLPLSEVRQQSEYLTRQFLASREFRTSSSIGLYASMPHEFDTRILLMESFKHGKRVFLPRVVKPVSSHKMVMLEVRSMAELEGWQPNNWGIREPPIEAGRADAPRDASLDAIVLPGVAFDASGARCGHGMGFYDTYLRRYWQERPSMPYLVALALRPQFIENVPMTESDWRLDRVITPEMSISE